MELSLSEYLNPLDIDRLRPSFRQAQPAAHVVIDELLRGDHAREIMAAYPSFTEACAVGRRFHTVNERGKVQVSDPRLFAPPIAALHAALRQPSLLNTLSEITGIPELLVDDELTGAGLHLMDSGAYLDVHIDFNRLPSTGWHRRLNLILFLNDPWPDAWGGELEFWDGEVKTRSRQVLPALNRCVIFATTQTSYHGVSTVRCPVETARRSFSIYYYTLDPPRGFDGTTHDTIFRARPSERLKSWALMPAERATRALTRSFRAAKSKLRFLRRSR